MFWSKNAPTACLPRRPAPSGFVIEDSPIGSSMTTLSAITASRPSRSPACTHLHDACDAVSAGEAAITFSDMGIPPGSRSAICAGVADDAANIAALQHVPVAVVDLVEFVLARHHVVEVELARLVHRQQQRDVMVRVAAA